MLAMDSVILAARPVVMMQCSAVGVSQRTIRRSSSYVKDVFSFADIAMTSSVTAFPAMFDNVHIRHFFSWTSE